MKADVEIEIKLPIENKEEVIQKLEKLGAKFVNKKLQTDTLFNSDFAHFEKTDSALRLRQEIYEDGSTKSILTYKGSPTVTKDGHRIRDEYETEVNHDQTYKLLHAIGFKEEAVIEKTRSTYHFNNLDIAVDELPFGTFLEIEGAEKDIEVLRSKLNLQSVEPVTRGYIHLQWDYEKAERSK